jgi:uncharacterized protein (UPF0305 family)
MKILVHHSKYGDRYINAEDEAKALRYHLRDMIKEFYSKEDKEKAEEALKSGDKEIRRFLKSRQYDEYEAWDIQDVEEPS